jgi:hypothetical protein
MVAQWRGRTEVRTTEPRDRHPAEAVKKEVELIVRDAFADHSSGFP